MSGCHPPIESCRCLVCLNSADKLREKVISLERQILSLTEMYKELSISVSRYQDTKVLLNDFIKSANGRIENLQRYVKNLESHYYSDDDLSAIHGAIRNLEKNNKFDEHQHQRLENKINILEEVINRITEDDMKCGKKPHKCPVCEGRRKDKDRLVAEPYDQQIKVLINPNCRTCEGKGIVWG